jgi:hypothetical protein
MKRVYTCCNNNLCFVPWYCDSLDLAYSNSWQNVNGQVLYEVFSWVSMYGFSEGARKVT